MPDSRSVWSAVAWELAHHATFDTTDEGKARATLATFTLLTPLIGIGNTTNEAMQDLAIAIDRYGERARQEARSRRPLKSRPVPPLARHDEHTPRGLSGDPPYPLTNTVEQEERASWADREPDDDTMSP